MMFEIRNDLSQLSYASINNVISCRDDYNIYIGDSKIYSPSPTAKLFHADSSSVKVLMGPIRSGKSSADCAEIVRLACAMQPCKDGVRRLRVAVIRNTYPDLETTTVKTWQNWWGNLGKVSTRFDSPIEFVHEFNDGKGDIELVIWFMALDKEKDIRRLLSLEVTFAYCNELRELSNAVFMHLRGRVGQYPRKCDLMGEEVNYWYGIIGDTNPPDTDSWLYKLFEVDKPQGFSLYKQPSALIRCGDKWAENQQAENIKNLPTGYYQALTIGSSEEYIKVYVLGEYGMVYDGKPVFQSYNDDIHSVECIKFDEVVNASELLVGWDFGLTPAAVICALKGSKMYLLKEFTTERMYPDELIKIVSGWINANLSGKTIHSSCDPSGSELYLQEMLKCGLPTIKAHTNEIEPRVSSVNYFLTRLEMGQPAFILDRKGCPELRKGFMGKYCYERVRVIGEERYRDMPCKSHPISDIQDALQYVCLRLMNRMQPQHNADKMVDGIVKTNLNINRARGLMYGSR